MKLHTWLTVAFATLLSTHVLATDSWLYSGRIGGTYIYNQMSDADLTALLDLRASENVSILELDSRLSYYLNQTEFDTEVAFLDRAAKLANERGMKAVIYYPTFEVLTADAIDNNGVLAASTMATDHPEWLQQGIDGTPNVFYGGQEVWVSDGEESAWLSPNSEYKQYFIDRVKQLAATDLDGVWLDVPIYLDTGTLWAGAEPAAAADFQAWSIAQGHNGGAGYTVPAFYNMSDAGFRAWIKWRHINVASFLNDVRAAAQSVNSDFAVIVENFPLDYFDGTGGGLDGSYLPVENNLIRVWETDNVSNTQAMKWSTPDDFENKIAMLKWGKSVHSTQPSWSFSYGHEIADAGLTMAATVATQNVPFESKTPSMLNTVDTNFRQNWFGYIDDHEPELFGTDRMPNMAIWYSSATRDFQDYDQSGKFGIFSVTTPPTPDDSWWANNPSDSVVSAPHLGGYRGMSAAMIRMNIPYTVVHGRDNGPLASSGEHDMLILPSVGAMSDEDAAYIRQYVLNGGVLLATGGVPGVLDETGATRTQNALADVFAFSGAPAARVNQFGDGLAIYRPDIVGTQLFGEQLDANTAANTLSEIEKLVRIHVDEPFVLENAEHVYAERAVVSDNEHLVYLVNYSGLQLPLVQNVKTVVVHYRVPKEKFITGIVASTPDSDGLNGFVTFSNRGNGVYKIDIPLDQFGLLKIQLGDAPAAQPVNYAGPQFDDPIHEEAALSGLNFVLDSMRNSSLAEPNRFGVHTNLLDNNDSTTIYTSGHNVTAEHMGLLLRTTACLGDQTAYDEAYRYVNELMFSPLYHVPNWSIDKNAQRPFLFYDDFRNNWFNANAPLDDLRLIHGLVDGHENFGRDNANELADTMLEGLYWTSVTDRSRNSNNDLFPQYGGGLLGFAWDWSEENDNALTPAPALATGTGYLGTDLLPVDYQDLGAIAHAAARDYRWESVLQSTTQLLLDSEITLSGLYYNGYRPNGEWTGDFEYQGTRRGEHLKTIQVLWTAIHLARASTSTTETLTSSQKALAQGSAARSLSFFKNFYQANNRVPEYLKLNGTDVDNCVSNQPADCLNRGSENLFNGEARIYAQIARLALLLGDKDFSNQIINEKIITDRITNQSDVRYGLIGLSTAGINDADAWNVLESVFSICLNALDDTDGGPVVSNNRLPVANTDYFDTDEETSVSITAAQLLGNDIDLDGDTLSVSGLPGRSVQGGSVELLQTGDWQYTPASGFTGADSISYAISDGIGGTAIGQININVRRVPKTTHLAEVITVLQGAHNYGIAPHLTADDTDTYDVDSASTATGDIVDWYISGKIDNRIEVTRLIVSYSGHYSVNNVTQQTYLYNFRNGNWVSFDTRTVGNESDSVVQIDITQNANEYIAADGETRIRIHGSHATLPVTVWANSVNWLAYRGNQSASNVAPLASNMEITTLVDTATQFSLRASDADGDALFYTLDTSALNGTVSRSAENITYTPALGFSGTDLFSYTVSDGTLTSSPATVQITVMQAGVITNLAAAITLDGDLSDWSGYLPFAADPDDVSGPNGPLNWQQAWMAHDGTDYYLAFRNFGAVNPSWGQTVYIDIDDNPATGYQQGLSLGADRVLQGRFLYRYTGTGSDWAWEFVTEVSGQSNNGEFEYRFPYSALANSELIHLAFVGSNEPYGGVAEDLYPDSIYDSAAVDRKFTYVAAQTANSAPTASDLSSVTIESQAIDIELVARDNEGDVLTYSILTQTSNGTLSGTPPNLSYLPSTGFVGNDAFTYQVSDGGNLSRIATVSITVQSPANSASPSNLVTQLNIDGNLSEWALLQSNENDPDDVSGTENPVDYLNSAMAHDASNFYLTFSLDNQDVQALPGWLFTIYMDTDLNPATGYNGGLVIGADHMQQGTGVFAYAGTGNDWTWSPVATSQRQASGTNVELSIPRQALGDPEKIHYVLIGDNFSLGGGVEDLYPDGTYDDSAAIRYLAYSTNGSPSSPTPSAATTGLEQPVSGRESLKDNPMELSRQSDLEANYSSGGGSDDDGSSGGFGGGFGAIGMAGLLFAVLMRLRRYTLSVKRVVA